MDRSTVEANPPYLRELTARLYGGDEVTRVSQEALLGADWPARQSDCAAWRAIATVERAIDPRCRLEGRPHPASCC